MKSKILLADDSPNILSFLEPSLKREGYFVVTAEDGETALYLWETEHPDLMILDIEMPEPNGLAVCRRVRESGDQIPIIFLTVRDSVSDLEIGFALGASDYISKPFDIRELLARVKARLPPDVREFAGYLRIDGPSRLILVNREGSWEPVDLTPREFDLLLYLINNAGRPIGRSALLEAVFEVPDGRGIETKTLEKHIWSLRQKIEPEPKDPQYLINVRGVGYKFDVP
jgi:two-component system alkaline phosphatase synthesis response regulator PhoP